MPILAGELGVQPEDGHPVGATEPAYEDHRTVGQQRAVA